MFVVLSNQVVPSKSRISFALVKPIDLTKNRVNIVVDTFLVRHYPSKWVSSRDRRGFTGKVSLKDMFLLNMWRVEELPEHFG